MDEYKKSWYRGMYGVKFVPRRGRIKKYRGYFRVCESIDTFALSLVYIDRSDKLSLDQSNEIYIVTRTLFELKFGYGFNLKLSDISYDLNSKKLTVNNVCINLFNAVNNNDPDIEPLDLIREACSKSIGHRYTRSVRMRKRSFKIPNINRSRRCQYLSKKDKFKIGNFVNELCNYSTRYLVIKNIIITFVERYGLKLDKSNVSYSNRILTIMNTKLDLSRCIIPGHADYSLREMKLIL